MKGVLIVDDAIFMRESIKKMLEGNGYYVAGEAGDGVEAIEVYRKVKPDLVLLDITMPDMNGIEALKRIKQLDSNAKIIICSAMGYQDMIAQSIQSGAEDFIVKPFDATRLIAVIKKVLGKL